MLHTQKACWWWMCRSEGTVWGGCEQKSWTDVKEKKEAVHEHAAVPKTKALKQGLVEIHPPVQLLLPLLLHWGLQGGAETQPSCLRAITQKQDASHIGTNPYLHSHSGPIQRCQFGQMRKSSDCGKELEYLQRGAHYSFYHVHQIWLTKCCFWGTRDRRVLLQ